MIKWGRLASGSSRAALLTIAMISTAMLSRFSSDPISWEIALIYGITLGIAMKWPIILPRTGVRIVLLFGLVFDALWNHGWATFAAVVLIEFSTLMVYAPVAYLRWQWFRPVLISLSVAVAYFSSPLLWHPSLLELHTTELVLGPVAVYQVFVAWWVLNGLWTVFHVRVHRLPPFQEIALRIWQTWWAPPVFVTVAWLMAWVNQLPLPITLPVCLLLLYVGSRIGAAFTRLYQDRAVADLLRLVSYRVPQGRESISRSTRYVQALARDMDVSTEELTVIGYAALLQDLRPEGQESNPLWIEYPQIEQTRAETQGQVDYAVDQISGVGTLEYVANLVALRHASYDGSGIPAVSGSVVPLGAKILHAANAMTTVSERFGGDSPEAVRQAVRWLHQHARARFDPMVMTAMLRLYSQPAAPEVKDTRRLPDTVRQLRSLVGDERPSTLLTGLRRVWGQMKHETQVTGDSLPDEVLAVARMAGIFARSTSISETAQIIAQTVGDLLGAKVTIALADDPGNDFSVRYHAAYGFTHLNMVGRVTTITEPSVIRSVLNNEAVQIYDILEVSSPIAHQIVRSEGIRSVLYVPLAGRDRNAGLIMVGVMRHHWFTPREIGLVQLIAGQATAALQNASLMAEVAERLEHISRLNAFTDTLLDNLSTSIVVVDSEGRLRLANAAARHLFGRSFPLIAGQPLPEPLKKFCPVEIALTRESIGDQDIRWNQATLEVQAAPLYDPEGQLIGAVSLARDVTRMRNMEGQVRRVEKLAAIGELAAGAAHEIRNPLTSIRGFIQLMHARVAGRDAEFFQIILSEIDRIDQIIRDLLLLARPADLQPAQSSLVALTEEVLLIHEQELQHRGVQVDRRYKKDPGPVSLDPRLFRQLLHNLIINAIQAMPEGGRLAVSIYANTQGEAVLEIADSGGGISEEDLKRLFVPFFTTKEDGTGLGLALCHSIVQAHSGRIDVHSKAGEGSSFLISLPVQSE